MLGSALANAATAYGEEVALLSHSDLDITSASQVLSVTAAVHPDLLLHAAALTRVNYCEDHPEEALLVNATGTAHVVRAAEEAGARMVYFSTDYVFPGSPVRRPILEDAKFRPLNAYGNSKLAGEEHVAGYSRGHIVRVSGVFGPRRNGLERNFFRAIFDKLHQTAGPIDVVNDQVTAVSYGPHIASMLFGLLRAGNLPQVVHLTSAGADSWFLWARKLALEAGFDVGRIIPVPTPEGDPVRRPAYSVLGSGFEAVSREICHFPATEGIGAYVQYLRGK
jgi:dTDP-4-dehydrorhamnose reductase